MGTEIPEKIISKYDPVTIEGQGKGRLVVTSRRIIFEKKKGFISSKVIPQITIDVRSLISVDQSDDFGVKISHQEEGKGAISHKVIPNNPTEAIEIVQTISSMLGERKLAKDRKELSERDLKLMETKYLSYILDVGSKIWELTSLSFSMLRGLGLEDWDRTEDALERLSKTTSSLTKDNSFDFDNKVDLIRSSVKSRSIQKVGESISVFIEALGNDLNSAAPPASEWKDYVGQRNPDWGSLSYLFLFSLALSEGSAFTENAQEGEREAALSKAKKLIPILGVEFREDIFKDASTDEDQPPFEEMASKFNTYLRDALQDSLRETSLLA